MRTTIPKANWPAVIVFGLLLAGCSGAVTWEEQEQGVRDYFASSRVEKPDYGVFQGGKAVIVVFGFADLDPQDPNDGDEGVCQRTAAMLNEEAGEQRFTCGPMN